MSFVPSTAAQNTAALAGSNQATLASPLTALQTSITGGNLAPAALIDAILSAVGVQLESNNALSANSTTSTSFVDVPGSSITFTAPIAKKYVVHCDFSLFQNGGIPKMRLVVNGDNGPTLIASISTNATTLFHLMHSATCSAGSNTIKLQWASSNAGTIQTDANSVANYIVSG